MSTFSCSFSERTILISGASSGIGKETAQQLARAGARCLLLGRDTTRLETVQTSLEGSGHLSISVDFENLEEAEQKLSPLLKEVGPLHGFVHSAGVAPVLTLRDNSFEMLEKTMHTNWLSFMLLSRLICRRGGYAEGLSVVAIASLAGTVGHAGMSLYSGTKGALIASSLSLASEFAPRGIRFNCVSPSPVDTPMQQETRALLGDEWYQHAVLDKARLGVLLPEDVAHTVLFLLSDASRRITGQNIIIDSGYTLY